jgi:hypothetical protein
MVPKIQDDRPATVIVSAVVIPALRFVLAVVVVPVVLILSVTAISIVVFQTIDPVTGGIQFATQRAPLITVQVTIT